MAVSGISNFDDRAAIRQYRRDYLLRLCQQEGIAITEQETKDKLIFKMVGAGIDPNNPPKIETDPSLMEEPGEPKINYGSLNFFQLRKLCTERGISWEKTDKRTDLLVKLGA